MGSPFWPACAATSASTIRRFEKERGNLRLSGVRTIEIIALRFESDTVKIYGPRPEGPSAVYVGTRYDGRATGQPAEPMQFYPGCRQLPIRNTHLQTPNKEGTVGLDYDSYASTCRCHEQVGHLVLGVGV